jgi:hypothetical protein
MALVTTDREGRREQVVVLRGLQEAELVAHGELRRRRRRRPRDPAPGAAADLGFGHVVALHLRSATLYQLN